MSEPVDDFDQFDPQGGGQENPWLKKILSNAAFYPGGEPGEKADSLKKKVTNVPRFFVVRRPTITNIFAGIRFWCKTGGFDDKGQVNAAPFYSSHTGANITKWTYPNKRGGTSFKLPKDRPTDDVMGKFVRDHPGLIAPDGYKGKISYWDDGSPKMKCSEVFAMEVFEVLFVDSKPVVQPTPMIFEMRRNWWQMYRAIIKLAANGGEIQATPDTTLPDGTVVPGKPAKKMATTDLSKTLLLFSTKFVQKEGDTELRPDYKIDFSTKAIIDSSALQVVDPLPAKADGTIDWVQVYPPMTEANVTFLVNKAKTDDGAPETEAAPASTPAAAAGQGTGAAAKSAGDDIPF